MMSNFKAGRSGNNLLGGCVNVGELCGKEVLATGPGVLSNSVTDVFAYCFLMIFSLFLLRNAIRTSERKIHLGRVGANGRLYRQGADTATSAATPPRRRPGGPGRAL